MSRMTTDELLARYPDYYKDVRHLEVIDIYRILDLYGVTDPTVQHAVKKLLIPGKRSGGKAPEKDMMEAVHTLERGAIMREEDMNKGKLSPKPAVVVTNTVSAPSISDKVIQEMITDPTPIVPVRDINACAIPECTARREIGSSFCSRHQPPKAPEAPKPWSQGDYSAPPPPPPPAAPPQSTVWQAPNPVPEPAVKHKPDCTEKVSALVCPCNDFPVASLPVPVPSLPTPSLPVDGLALAVHNNVNASSPSPLPRC